MKKIRIVLCVLFVLLGAGASALAQYRYRMFWDQGNGKLHVPSLVLAEADDPVDIVARRAPILSRRSTLLVQYGQAHDGTDFEGQDCLGRSQIIYFQTDGMPTRSSRPGRIGMGTTRPGECDPRESWALESDGRQNWSGQPTVLPVSGMRTCAMVKITWFDGSKHRDGFVPILCQ